MELTDTDGLTALFGAAPSRDASDVGPRLLCVEEAAERLGIGRTLMYKLVRRGEVDSIVLGRLRRIPAECVDEYVDRLRDVARSHRRAGR